MAERALPNVSRVRGEPRRSFARVHALARRFLPPILLIAAAIGLWQAWVTLLSVPSYIVPAPSAVWDALFARGWDYLPDAWVTLQEILAGFGLGLAVGVPLAFAITASRVLRDALYPLLISSQMVPIFALAAVVTIIFSYGMLPQIIVTALYSFFPIVVNAADGLGGVDPDLVRLLRAAGAPNWQIYRCVRLPGALPSLFSGAKLAITFAVTGAVIGEWIGGESGLGYLMRFQNSSLDVAGMFATMIVLSLLGIVLFAAVGILEYILVPWHRRSDLGDLWRSGR